MRSLWGRHSLCIATIALGMGGCGTSVPTLVEVWDGSDPNATRTMEYSIKRAVFCELARSAQEANNTTTLHTFINGKEIKTPKDLYLPDSWGAQVTISLQVDETSALSPGASFNAVMPNAITTFVGKPSVTTPQSFAFGLGGTLSSQATRVDKFNFYYSVSDLMRDIGPESWCLPQNSNIDNPSTSSPFLVVSDLGIKKWLKDALYVDRPVASSQMPAGAGGAFRADSISYEIKFIVVSSANATPTWKLVRFTGDTGSSPLFSANRTRTYDLLITIGPNTTATANSHLASQIGLSVTNGLRNILPP